MIVLSGDANGSDVFWAQEWTRHQVKVMAIIPPGQRYVRGPGEVVRVPEHVLQDGEGLIRKVIKLLGRRIPQSKYAWDLIRRDVFQVISHPELNTLDSQAVFGVGGFDTSKWIDGGTAYAVTVGILKGLPVVFFCQDSNTWFYWDYLRLEWLVLPEQYSFPPFHAISCVGSRDLKPSGRVAIQEMVGQLTPKKE